MIESGQVKAIDDDIEKYMPDRLKEIYDKYPETFYPVTKDGKTYGIACTPCMDAEEIMVIRQAGWTIWGFRHRPIWTSLKLSSRRLQKTTQMETAKMIRMDSPIPEMIFTITGWVSDPVNVFSAYSGKFIPGVWQEDEDGNLQYGSINEENKEDTDPYGRMA